MMVKILDIVIAGLLMGGIYALIAVGLSLQYGVARVLNIAHGEFIMLGAFSTWSLYTIFGINPLVSCFGLLFIIQNVAILIWGADIKGYSYLAFPVNLGGAIFAANRVITLGFAMLIGFVFYLFLARTRLGKAIRAAAQDPATAGLMGVNINQVLALCFGFGALMAGLGGTLISMSYKIEATMGLEYTIIALIVIVLGGLGSIPGSFIGGLLLGLVGSIVTYIEPGLALVAYYVIFMLLLLAKPTGILGK